MMQQMNLFNTSPEVAGFKLDYLEVWNWGTFDQKVYCMNTQGSAHADGATEAPTILQPIIGCGEEGQPYRGVVLLWQLWQSAAGGCSEHYHA